jgi:hypothetical protein
VELGISVQQQLWADSVAYFIAIVYDCRVLDREHIETVRRPFEVSGLGINEFNRPAPHIKIRLKVTNGIKPITKVPQVSDYLGILETARPIHVRAMHLKDDVRCCATWQ